MEVHVPDVDNVEADKKPVSLLVNSIDLNAPTACGCCWISCISRFPLCCRLSCRESCLCLDATCACRCIKPETCCKTGMQLCCLDFRGALPTEDEAPCGCGCCGFMCVDKR